MISATMVADSKSSVSGDRLSTMLITFPRFILAELNTHRMLSKNSASSRAIPFQKMVKSVQENPFIPIAWQKDHKGMQGTEYLSIPKNHGDIAESTMATSTWLSARDYAVKAAQSLHSDDNGYSPVTKQLCNRLLEPFMYHTVLISGTEWENFFELRCPQYTVSEYSIYDEVEKTHVFKSKKDLLRELGSGPNGDYYVHENDSPSRFKRGAFTKDFTDLDWLEVNKGQAEIHMMSLAEAMWDCMNESTPNVLQPGEWHIPFVEVIGNMEINDELEKLMEVDTPTIINNRVKISTAMAARTSYTIVGDEKEISYEALLGIHDRMATAKPFHASPFEHCARMMDKNEYDNYIKGYYPLDEITHDDEDLYGWCRNYRGFIQYRHTLEYEV